jgi:hypothetical protein
MPRAAGVGMLVLSVLGAITLMAVGAFDASRLVAARTVGVVAPTTDTTSPAVLVAAASAAAVAAAKPHIMMIVEENEGYSDIIGSSSAPYVNSLAKTYASATNWYAVQHNSPHDYLDLTVGSDLGLPNGTPYSVATVVDELHSGGVPWKSYMESMPSNCANGSTSNGLYDAIHNPFHYFTKYTSASGGWCNSANLGTEGVLPNPGSSGLVAALDGAGAPDFVVLVPNDCDNMHGDTSAGSPCASNSKTQLIKAGDTWLSTHLPGVLTSTWFKQNGIVIVTWDEGSDSSGCCGLGSPGGHIATIVMTTGNQGSGSFPTTGDHYGTLRAIEEAYGVGFLGGSAKTVNGDLTGAFGTGKVTTGSISGTVTDSVTTTALAGATISYSGGSTTTNSSGAYALAGVLAGTYTVTASATGYTSGSASVTVVAGANATKNFGLLATHGAISGKVTDAQTTAAITGATVTCTCASSGVVTGASGSYSFTNVIPGGGYSLVFSDTGYVSQTINNVGVIAGHVTTENVALGKPPGGITGTVTDATASGAPTLAGVSVTCTCQSGNATTDGVGRYSFTNIAPGSYALTFREAGFVTQTITGVGVTSGATTVTNAALIEDGGIKGTVTDAQNGSRISAATITCSGCPTTTVTTDGTGNYFFTGVPNSSSYSLTFTASGYASRTITNVTVTGPASTSENLALDEDGGISGTVIDAQTSQSLPGVTVKCNGGCPTAGPTDSLGDYSLINVPPGTYSLTFSESGYVTQTVSSIVVAPGFSTIVNRVALTEDGEISGTVTDQQTAVPISGATVTCTCQAGSVSTDASGFYSFTSIVPGSSYTVSVTAIGFTGLTSSAFAVNPGLTSTVNLQLSAISKALKVVETFGAANAGTTGSTSLTATTVTATGKGDLLVVTVRDRSSPLTSVSGISDTSSGLNIWKKATGIQNTQGDEEIWYVANAASVTGVAVNVTGAASLAMTVLDISGAVVATPLDRTSTSRGSGTAASTGTTATTSQVNEIVVADIGWNSSVSPSKQTAGYTEVASQQSKVSGTQTGEQAAWRVVNAIGAQSFAATLSASVSWLGAIATFK